MPSLGNTPRPAYVYDTETDTWVPIGVGAHTHDDLYVNQSVIDAKGDLLVGTADNSYARLAKGADGTVLVADNTTQTGLAWQPYGAIQVAGKNKVINGDFGIWQRGTTITYSSQTIYSADRWLCSGFGSGQPFTITRSTSGVPSGFRYYARISPTTSNVTNLFFTHSLETANVIPLQGQNVILSLYYRTPVNFTAQWGAEVVYSTGTDANLTYPNASTLLAAATMTNSASWQRLVINCGVLPVTATSLTIQLYTFNNLVNGAQLDITGVQLEAGTTVTPFTTSAGNPASELAACQRYFYTIVGSEALSNNQEIVGLGTYTSSTGIAVPVRFPVKMRTSPSISHTGGNFAISGGGGGNATTVASANFIGPNAANLGFTSNVGSTTGYSANVVTNAADCRILFSSEI